MRWRISPHSLLQCKERTIGTKQIKNKNQNHTTSEQHHIRIRTISLRPTIFGVLQRSLAFFSDRGLKWVGDGLEDLGDLGDLGDLKDYGILDWQEKDRRCRARTGPGMKENPRNLHGQDSEPATMAFIQFNSLAENLSEKRAHCAAKIPAFSHFQHSFIRSMARAIQHSFIRFYRRSTWRSAYKNESTSQGSQP